ncbi:hypothetical protein AWM70_16015 [Paenibacillus yonginensis]|uniref:YfbU family protein n=1 Tax=Paenibacillus yonginensis TaxID=1462996 RepID=A0A1B1N395_9BACL|nr:YfbU family protein [Paenibacillus yonginensis]ANS75904.1 hypothetical protein AWM70_16015 [Paenibacillus yonginensis]
MLTKTERLILSNQLQILKALNLGDGDYYDEKIKILQRGYAHYYDQVLDMVSDDIPEHISDEVFLILNMFRALQLSFEEWDGQEQPEASRPAASDMLSAKPGQIYPEILEFRGFSRHWEFQHFSFASFVIDEDGQYEEFSRPEGYDSLRPMLPQYRYMLRQWSLTGRKQALSLEEVRFITSLPDADAVRLFSRQRGQNTAN